MLPLMMCIHRSTTGKLPRPLPFRSLARRSLAPARRFTSESKNLPSAPINRLIAREPAWAFDLMRLEQQVILPAAEKSLEAADWRELDAAFGANRDPLSGKYPRDPLYDRLFTRIVLAAPEPIGLGSQR